MFVVTGQSFAGIVLSQVPSLSPERVVLEPSGRNTAPCLALGTAKILGESGCDPIVVALPSDHWVPDVQPFKQTVEYMIEAARNTGCIVTAGIVPTRPEPAYGYLKAGTPLDIHRGPTSVSRAGASDGPGPSAEPRVFRVTEFVEKPPLDKARLLHSSGGWYWNSGMFCYTASRLMEAYSWALPHDAEALKELVGAFSENPCPNLARYSDPFSRLTKVSFDSGVMEKWQRIAMVPAGFDWDDLGSWPAIERLYGRDEMGNTSVGDAVLVDCRDCTVVSEDSFRGSLQDPLGKPVPLSPHRTIVAFGLEDTLVVDGGGAVLVCPRARSPQLKELLMELEKRGRRDLLDAPAVLECQTASSTTLGPCGESQKTYPEGVQTQKPWGMETLWVKTDKFAGKVLFIRAGESLSLQYHERKSEAMACLSGYGFILSNGTRRAFSPGDSAVVPPGTVHRIEAETDLIVFEISTPELDDVVRLQDRYGRT